MDSIISKRLPPSRSSAELLRSLHRDLSRVLPQVSEATARDQADKWLQSVSALLNLSHLDERTVASRVNELVRICTRGRQQFLLSSYGLTYPPYNYFEDFASNALGPWDVSQRQSFVSPAKWTVLGQNVGLPIGVPASSLTVSANWVEYFASRGFNVITFKTMRSREWNALPEPNWVFLRNITEPLDPAAPVQAVGDEDAWPGDHQAFSMANSFGVPSFGPERWQAEVADSLDRLSSSQLLIVSVMGSAEIYQGDDLIEDFCHVARLAEDAGAPAIELNLSCPNTIAPEGNEELIAESPDTAELIVRAVREALKADTKLTIKLHHLPTALLEDLVLRTAPFIDGVSGINTLQTDVRRPDGSPTFPSPANPAASRKAGVSGIALRNYALKFIETVRSLVDQHDLGLDVIGMGGVMTSRDFEVYSMAGATAVLTATGAFFNPNLAREAAESFGIVGSGSEEDEDFSVAEERVLSVLSHHKLLEDVQIAGMAKITPGTVTRVISELVDQGRVRPIEIADRMKYEIVQS